MSRYSKMLSGMAGRGMWHPLKHSVNLTCNLQSFKNLHTASIEVCSLTDLITGRSTSQTEIWTRLWNQWPATTRYCTHCVHLYHLHTLRGTSKGILSVNKEGRLYLKGWMPFTVQWELEVLAFESNLFSTPSKGAGFLLLIGPFFLGLETAPSLRASLATWVEGRSFSIAKMSRTLPIF